MTKASCKSFDFKKSEYIKTIAKISAYIDSLDDEKIYMLEIKEKKQKRSLNANAYMWALCEQIAAVQGLTKEEVYRRAIKEVGIFRQAEIDDKAVNTLIHAWQLNGTGWIAEKADYGEHDGFSLINLYYGSSTYNTAQMSRLIDYIVQDCKALDIETLTDREISLLTEKWGN